MTAAGGGQLGCSYVETNLREQVRVSIGDLGCKPSKPSKVPQHKFQADVPIQRRITIQATEKNSYVAKRTIDDVGITRSNRSEAKVMTVLTGG